MFLFVSVPRLSMLPLNTADTHKEQEKENKKGANMYTSRPIRTTDNSHPTSCIRCTRNKNNSTKDNHSVAVRNKKQGREQKKQLRRSLGKLRIPVEVIPPG